MFKRSIRLKEFLPNLNKAYTPTEDYLKNANLQPNEIYLMRTNSEGNQYSIWKRESKNKIYIIGASSIESLYIRFSMRPHCILEKILLENGYDYSVYNLGFSGAQTLNIVNQIINKLGDKTGSKVIVSIPSNDYRVLTLKKNYYSDDWRTASIVPANNKNSERAPKMDYEPFKRNIELIIQTCKVLKLELFMTPIIYIGEHTNYAYLNKVAQSICLENNVPFLNLEYDHRKDGEFFYDSLHFLELGSADYAKKIFKAIMPSLISTGSPIISLTNICENEILKDVTIWSDSIEVNEKSIVKVIVDAAYPIDCKGEQAIICIHYEGENIISDLFKSDDVDIGHFKYISGPAAKRYEVPYDIKIPEGCTSILIGLRGLNSQKVEIIKSYIAVHS